MLTVSRKSLDSLYNFILFQGNVLLYEGQNPYTLADRVTPLPGFTRREERGFAVFGHLLEYLHSLVSHLYYYTGICMRNAPFASIMASGDPMFNDARSALEKYADILNFATLTFEKGGMDRFDQYFEYPRFLEKEANDKAYRQTKEHNDESARLCRMLGLGGSYVNRKSRYILAKRAHFLYLPPQESFLLSDFNRKLASFDSEFSHKIHRDAPDAPVNIEGVIDEIFRLVVMISVGAFYNFVECERIPLRTGVPSLSFFLPMSYGYVNAPYGNCWQQSF